MMFDLFLKYIDKLLDVAALLMDFILKPIHEEGTNKALTKKNLEANLRRAGVSQMLPYRIYREIDGVGIYTGDGDYDAKGNYKGDRHGFILRVQGSAFPNDLMQENVNSFLKKIGKKGVTVNFFSMASQNIETQIREFERYHQCKVNVREVGFLRKMVSNRAAILRRWARESMFGRTGGDFRLKELVSIVSVLFPEEMDMDEVIAEYGKLKSALGLPSKNFSAEELVTLLREFFHNEKDPEDWMHGADDYMAINRQVVAGGVKVDLDTDNPRINFTINDKTHVAVLTTKKFPRSITFSEFNSLFYDRTVAKDIPPMGSPFISTLTVVYSDEEETKKKAISKLTSDIEQLGALSSKKRKKKPELHQRLKESTAGLEAIKDGERVLEGMFNIIIFDTDAKKVERSIDGITSSFGEAGWELVPESFDHTAFNQTIFSLPLQFREEAYEYLERFDMLYRGNFAGIAPIISDSKGFWKNYHIPYISSTGQLQWFDPYASDTNYSIATAGDSGSGKSYTFADFAMLNLAAGYQVRIIDSLPSYKRVTNMIGGQYEDFSDKNICANFFTNLLVEQDDDGNTVYETINGVEYPVVAESEIQTLIPILGMLAGVDLKQIARDTDSGLTQGMLYSIFEDAIRTSWRRRRREAGMRDVYEFVVDKAEEEKKQGNMDTFNILHKVSIAFGSYGIEGSGGYSFFNGVNNIEIKYDLATYELTNLEARGLLHDVFLMLLANKIVNEFFQNKARPKCLIIDEFWKYKETPIVLKFIEELARKARKASGFIVPITQAITDYYSNVGMENVANSCAFKWILQQDPSVIEKAIEKGNMPYGRFLMSQIKKIKNNPPNYGEFAIMNGSQSLFTRLKVDKVSHWLYTTSPSDNMRMHDVSKRYGITELEAALFCAFKDTFEHATDDEALLHATTKEDDNWERYRAKEDERNRRVETKLKRILQEGEEGLELEGREVTPISGSGEELVLVIPHIRMSIDEKLSPNEYRHIVEATGVASEVAERVVSDTVDQYETGRWGRIAIDISSKAFFSTNSISIILQFLSSQSKEYLLRVDFSDMGGADLAILDEILDKMKSMGVGLIVSGVSEHIPLSLLVSDTTKYIHLHKDFVEYADAEKTKWVYTIINEAKPPVIVESDKDFCRVPESLADNISAYSVPA